MVKVGERTFAVKDGIVQITPEELEDLIDEIAFDQALAEGDELLPIDVAKRLMEENPVKVYRQYRDLTQKELAEKAGLSQAIVAAIENGTRQGTKDTTRALAAALGVDISDII